MSNIKLQESFISYDRQHVSAIRSRILWGDYEIIDPYLHDFIRRNQESGIEENAWTLTAISSTGDKPLLLDFWESNEPFPGAEKEGFLDWLAGFSPRNCNDWLMVPFLYHRHIADPISIDWRHLILPADRFLDPIVRWTRGMLLWNAQRDRLLEEVLHIPTSEARRMQYRYLRNEKVVLDQFNKTSLSNGQTLSEVLETRTMAGTYLAGSPNFHISAKLSEWMAPTSLEHIGYYNSVKG